MSTPLDLTIAIPAKNEEKNLQGCLDAIGKDFAKDIVLIDSNSTDKSIDIAQAFGVRVINFTWNGHFPKKRNWFLQNHLPTTKWIFFLDADEYLTEDVKGEIRKSLENSEKVGYWLNYTIFFLGRQLKGGYPLKKLALFKIGYGEYEKIDEEKWSNLDMEIHEHPILNGEVGTIKSRIDHQDFRGITHYMLKHNEYANWEAARLKKTLASNSGHFKWTWKQRLKYRLMKSVWIGPSYFMGSFFLLGGFRDGARGFAFAILKMSYFTQIYCKNRES